MECPPYCDIWDFSKPYLTDQQAHAGYYAPTLMNAWALVNGTYTDVILQVSTRLRRTFENECSFMCALVLVLSACRCDLLWHAYFYFMM